LQCVEAVGLDDLRIVDAVADRVDQGLAEQRVIVCDNECTRLAQFNSPVRTD